MGGHGAAELHWKKPSPWPEAGSIAPGPDGPVGRGGLELSQISRWARGVATRWPGAEEGM